MRHYQKTPLSNDTTCPWRKRSTKNGLPLYVSTCDDIDDILAFWTWRRADFQKWHHSFWLPDTCYGIMLMKCKVSIYTLKWLFLNERPFECINGWSPKFGEASFIRWNGDFENKYHFDILQIGEMPFKCTNDNFRNNLHFNVYGRSLMFGELSFICRNESPRNIFHLNIQTAVLRAVPFICANEDFNNKYHFKV